MDAGHHPAPMTPEVKQAISDEVRRQIDQERAQGQSAGSMGGQDADIFSDNALARIRREHGHAWRIRTSANARSAKETCCR